MESKLKTRLPEFPDPMPESIPYFSANQLAQSLPYEKLIPALRQAFQDNITVPQRLHYDIPNPTGQNENTLLLMPAWEAEKNIGVKLITVSPGNGAFNLPAIQGMYVLFDSNKGTPIALLDAKALTKIRTAATSALASHFLSRPDSQTLLMIGTGALAPELIKAHAIARPLSKVLVWGRNREKAANVANLFDHNPQFSVQVVENIEASIGQADIISCATLSEQPLVHGRFLEAGQHVDLVGSFKPNMREADDEVIKRASVFIDHDGATFESGDISIPIENGILKKTEIKADLFDLCIGSKPGRSSEEEITVFKSVGHALEDLAAANLAIKK